MTKIAWPGRSLIVGIAIFVALAPLLAVARQATLLGIAGLVGAFADLVEGSLLAHLPIDPVYGGAGLRLLGGIEPRGLAVAGPPGQLLHAVLPAVFLAPEYVADGAAVSALVDPGVTVLARVLAALLATAVLLAVASGLVRGMRRPSLLVAARLAQVWLLLDLAHEADLSIRDLEATGLPFALAALAPVDAHGQRTLVTTYLDAAPGALIGIANAALAVIACLLVAWTLLGASRLAFGTAAALRRTSWLAWLRALRQRGGRIVACRPSLAGIRTSLSPLRLLRNLLTSQSLVGWRSLRPFGAAARTVSLARLPDSVGLVLIAVMLSISPFRALAEGETAILIGTTPTYDDAVAAAPPVSEPEVSPDARDAELAAHISAPAAASADPPTPSASVTPVAAIDVPAAAAPSPEPSTGGASVVAVEGSGYQYTLRVNGKPTIVRGMGYNPWYAELPMDQRQQRYRRDFSAMREVGINTLEGWFQWQFDEVTLDEAHRQGLWAILPFELNQDYDYGDPATRAMFREQVTAWVLRYRDHPGVLMWGPGNEVMHRLIFPTAVQGQRDPDRERRADDFAAFYVELLDLIHELDPHHPVIYRDAEDLYFGRLRAALLKDGKARPWFIYGTNVYTQRLAEVIERWPTQGVDAPLLVSEFSPGGVGAAERPKALGWYWSAIRAHPKRVIGGVVYTWATRGPEDLDRVFGLTDESGAPVDGSLAALTRLFQEDAALARRPN